MTAPGERGRTARKYSDGAPASEPTLQEHVTALIVKATGQAALIDDLYDRMARQDAENVKLQGMLKALGGRVLALERAVPSETPEPSPAGLPVDPTEPSEAEKKAMRERLQAGTAAGIEANKSDRYRAGRTYRRDAVDVK